MEDRKKLRLGVVFGGKSDEYDVSIHSAANVLRALNEDKYDITKIGITREGRWYVTKATPEDIENNKWIYSDSNCQCVIPHDPTVKGILVFDLEDKASVKPIDCFFPVLHGDHGEDGEIQGLFSLSEIPFVGSGVKATANSMDKTCTKQIAKLTGVKMARDYVVKSWKYKRNPEAELEAIKKVHQDKYPLFVKPSASGSSVGVTKVHKAEELKSAVEEALKYDSKVLVEEAIKGRELEVAVLGNEEPMASGIGEILSGDEFYTYEAKYANPESKTEFVTDLPKEVVDEFKKTAIKIYQELDCRGLSRVDFFYTNEGDIVFNEINSIPGFTNISMYPMLWLNEGLPTDQLLDKLIAFAMEE